MLVQKNKGEKGEKERKKKKKEAVSAHPMQRVKAQLLCRDSLRSILSQSTPLFFSLPVCFLSYFHRFLFVLQAQ